MSDRLGDGFPADRHLASIRRDLPPADGSPAHARAVGAIVSEFETEFSRLDESVTGLIEVLSTYDPIQLLSSVTNRANMTTWTEGTRLDDAEETFTWDAKTEYLAGLALAVPCGSADVHTDATQKAMELTAAAFEATQAGLFLWSVGEGATGNKTYDRIALQMRMEHLLDRMSGYVIHLQEINDAVFEPRRNLYLDALGFCPSDIVRVVSRHMSWVNSEADRHVPLMIECEQYRDLEGFKRASDGFLRALNGANLWSPGLLEETTGLPFDQIKDMLTAMSTAFGSQPEFRLPDDDNVLRKKPFIDTGDDVFFIATPWAPAHSLHDWILLYFEENPNPRLRDRYLKGRSNGAERLVHSALATIFGSERVHANRHYDSAEGHGEIDCLVGGGTPAVVEVKSHLVTDRGRRGSRVRLERVTRDVLKEATDQTSRASEYIVAGGRTFASKQGAEAERLLEEDVVTPIQIVVSFEGIDPLAISISSLLETDEPLRVWVTDLSDFLVVRDFLGEPGPFLHYAHLRSDTSRPIAYMESDAVGSYLDDRINLPVPASADSDGGAPMLQYRSGLINDYYTKSELGFPAERQGLGIPKDIQRSLKETGVKHNSVAWWRVASAILNLESRDWSRFKRFRRHHPVDRLFGPPVLDVGIIISTDVVEPQVADGDPPVLLVPAT